jgi:hypothetical protein
MSTLLRVYLRNIFKLFFIFPFSRFDQKNEMRNNDLPKIGNTHNIESILSKDKSY